MNLMQLVVPIAVRAAVRILIRSPAVNKAVGGASNSNHLYPNVKETLVLKACVR